MSRISYFEARRAETFFREYRDLSLSYWKAKPGDSRDRFSVVKKVDPPESAESRKLREEVNVRFPDAYSLATRLGVGVEWISYPPPAVGGPAVPVNLLLSVVDQEMGHGRISRQKILDVIDRCIGTAQLAKKRALKRLLLPWYWIIDIPALIVRIPFLILRATGLPSSVEENVISHVVKIVLVAGFLAVAGYFGIRVTLSDLLNLMGK